MKISDALAATNCARFAAFEDVSGVPACDVKPGTTPVNGNGWRQACLAFTGPAFQGLNAASLGAKDLLWAQGRLHVLCGLYVGTTLPAAGSRMEAGCATCHAW